MTISLEGARYIDNEKDDLGFNTSTVAPLKP